MKNTTITTKTSASKDPTFSFAKGIGILLMVFAHSLTTLNPLIYFFSLFNMPLFYFITGYFFKEKYLDAPLEFAAQKIKRLYFPFIRYSIAFILLHNFFFDLHIYRPGMKFAGETVSLYSWSEMGSRIAQSMLRFMGNEPLLGALWFLRSLFIVCFLFILIAWSIKKLFPARYDLFLGIGVLLLFLTGAIGTRLDLPGMMGIYWNMIIVSVFYSGYLYGKYKEKIPHTYAGALLSLILLCVATFFYNAKLEVHEAGELPLFFFLTAVIGCYMVMVLSQKCIKSNSLLTRFLIIAGDYSLAIMALHFLAFKAVSFLKVIIYDYDISRLSELTVIHDETPGWWLAYTIAGILLPIGTMVVYKFVKTKTRQIVSFRKA